MQQLKEEFRDIADYRRRLQILTLSPFSLEQTASFFGTSIYMARKARKLSNDVGLIPDIDRMHKGKMIDPAVKKKVVEFHESDLVSRMCPGAKDFVVVRDSLGVKKRFRSA